MTGELFIQVAERFKALSEPARLRILDSLRAGELAVGQLGERTLLNQANLSKHLQLLHTLGFVTRRKNGLFVYYRLANDDVFQLCDIMCGHLARQSRRTSRHVSGPRVTATRRVRRERAG